MALVAIHEAPAGGRPEIMGVGRLCRDPGLSQAEFAVVVSDCWQGHGLGTRLLTRLVEIGRKEGLTRIGQDVAQLIGTAGSREGNLLATTIDTVGALIRAGQFKQSIEEDESTVEIYRRLSTVVAR